MILSFIHPGCQSTGRIQTEYAQAIHSSSDEGWSFAGND